MIRILHWKDTAMTSRRRGIDAIKLRSLTSLVTQADEEISKHVKECYQCSHNKANPTRWCDNGWVLAKMKARAVNDLTVYKGSDIDDGTPTQGVLF